MATDTADTRDNGGVTDMDDQIASLREILADREQPIAEVLGPANEVVQGIARSIVSGHLHAGNRWSPNPEEWPAQMRRDWARWQPDAARWRQ